MNLYNKDQLLLSGFGYWESKKLYTLLVIYVSWMDYIQLVVVIAVAFTVIVTALNWSKLEPLQRILHNV